MEEQQADQFIRDTQASAFQLERTGIWQGIEPSRIARWLQQLSSIDCDLLAACVLDNLTFRSKTQVISLLTAALMSPSILPSNAQSDFWLIDQLRQQADPGVRLVPVIALDQPPTKSGPYILRLVARSLGLNEKWMLWAERLATLPENVHTIIAVDDFLGSGSQFRQHFLESESTIALMKRRPDIHWYYLTAAAHKDGVDSLHTTAPDLVVVAGEVITRDCHFFERVLPSRYNDESLTTKVRAQYDTWAQHRSFGKRVGPLGFDNQALLYAFAHGTPNNSLPLLWHTVPGWDPLLDR